MHELRYRILTNSMQVVTHATKQVFMTHHQSSARTRNTNTTFSKISRRSILSRAFFFFFFLSSITLCEFWLVQLFLSMVSFPVPSVSNYLLPSSSNRLSRHKTFHVPIYMFSLLFLNTHVGRLLIIRPSFNN